MFFFSSSVKLTDTGAFATSLIFCLRRAAMSFILASCS